MELIGTIKLSLEVLYISESQQRLQKPFYISRAMTNFNETEYNSWPVFGFFWQFRVYEFLVLFTNILSRIVYEGDI